MVSTWNTAQSGSWNVAADWTGGIPNATDATANFTALGSTVSPWSIDLGGATYTVGTLNVSASVIEHYDFDNGTLAMKISSTARGASAFINVTSANTSSFSALDNTLTLRLTSRTTIDNLTAGKFGVDAKITGAGALIATGLGTVLIGNSNNNWTGGLDIEGGTVQAVNANVLAGGALDVNDASAILDLNGYNQSVGNLSGDGTIQTLSGNATLTVNETSNTTFSGTFEDGVLGYVSGVKLNLTKTGAGTLTLAGNNATQGTVTISQGAIKLGAGVGDALSIYNGVSIASGASLNLGGFNTQLRFLSGAGSVINSGSGANYLVLTGTSSFSGSISGAVSVQVAFGPTLTLSGANSYTGTTGLEDNSILKAGAANAFSAASAYGLDTNSSIDLNGYDETISGLSGTGKITNNTSGASTGILTFQASGVTIFTGKIIDGAGGGLVGLDVSGAGQLVLAGANTYSGSTTIENGATLGAGGDNTLSSHSVVDVKSGGVLDLAGYNESVGGLTDSGSVTNSAGGDVTLTVGGSSFSGAITDGAGVVSLTVAAGVAFHLSGQSNTYSGTTSIGAGSTLYADNYGALGADSVVNISANSKLSLGFTDQTIGGLTGSGSVALTTSGYTTLTVDETTASTFSGQFSAGPSGTGVNLDKTGAATLTLSGANAQAGDMTVETGTLAAGAANSFTGTRAVIVYSGATLDLGGFDQTIGNLSYGLGSAGTVTNSGATAATLTINGTQSYFTGTIKDGTSALGISLAATAVLSLGGANTYTGATKIGAGAKLSASAVNAFSASSAVTIGVTGILDLKGYNETIGAISGTGSVTNSGAAAATLTENNAAAASFSGTLVDGSKSLAFTKTGAGQLKLSGTNSYSGGTTIQGGVLEFASAASAGSGAITFAVGATLQLDGATVLTNTIEDFAVGDSIDLAGIAFAAGDHFVLQSTAGGVQTWALETAANNVVTTLKLAGHYQAGDFTVAAQSSGTAVGVAHNPQPLADDFNADLKSDILMTNPANGQLLIWEMDGTTRLATSGKTSSYPGTNFTIIGKGDFNGDGQADILMQDQSTGHTTIWLMDGTTRLPASGQAGTNQGAAYKALGAGDFNGDGKADIVWENTTTGQVSVWLMDGTTKLSGANVGTSLPSDWKFAGTGDFDGDGKADIVFQNNTTGAVKIWLMDGTTKVGGGTLAGTSGAGHQIVGIGDFDGDGKSDLLWENTSTTALSIWFMDGMTRTSHDSIGDAVAGHQVVSIGDYNGDGMADILLQTTSSGHLNAWLMDGSTKLPGSGSVSSNPGTTWHVVS